MKKNYDFNKGVRGAHRDQTFTVRGSVKSESAEADLKATPARNIVIKTNKRDNSSLKNKAVV